MITFLIILAIYLIGAVVTYGFARADMDEFRFRLLQRFRFPVNSDITPASDRGYCILVTLLWPVGLFGVIGAMEKGPRQSTWRLISKLPSNKE